MSLSVHRIEGRDTYLLTDGAPGPPLAVWEGEAAMLSGLAEIYALTEDDPELAEEHLLFGQWLIERQTVQVEMEECLLVGTSLQCAICEVAYGENHAADCSRGAERRASIYR